MEHPLLRRSPHPANLPLRDCSTCCSRCLTGTTLLPKERDPRGYGWYWPVSRSIAGCVTLSAFSFRLCWFGVTFPSGCDQYSVTTTESRRMLLTFPPCLPTLLLRRTM